MYFTVICIRLYISRLSLWCSQVICMGNAS